MSELKNPILSGSLITDERFKEIVGDQFLTNFDQKIPREADTCFRCFIFSENDGCFGFILHNILIFF